MERLYWNIEPYISGLSSIVVNEKLGEIFLISDDVKKLEALTSKNKSIKIRVFSKKEAKKLISQGKKPFSPINELAVIYDSDSMLQLDERGDNKINVQK